MKKILSKLLVGAALLCSAVVAKAQNGLEGIIVEDYYTITAADAAAVNPGSYPLVAGMKVYRVYVDMAPNYRLNTVFGSPIGGGGVSPNPLDFTTTTTFWNDDGNGSSIPGQTAKLDEGLAFDTYVTIGRTGASGGVAGCGSNTQQLGVLRTADTNGNLTLCSTYPGFTGNDGNIPGTVPNLSAFIGGLVNLDALTTNGSALTVINDAWATLPNQVGVDPTGSNRVLIGQFTTDGTFSFHINLTLARPAPSTTLETYVWQTAGAGEIVRPELSYNSATPPACIPAAITSTSPSSAICSSSPALNLSLSTVGTYPLTYTWTGTGTITNGNTETATVTGYAAGNYNIAVSNACGSVNQDVAVAVTPAPAATISYPGTPYCSNGGTAPVTLTGTTGGSFTAGSGLVLNLTTGAITLGASTPGTYTVTYFVPAASGCASFSTTTSVTVTAAPSATIVYSGTPFCSTLASASVTRTGTAGGTYSSTPAGLSLNSSTGAINITASTAGAYTVTYSVAAAGGCALFSTTAPVTITAAPVATIAYPGTPYCSNGGTASVSLTGTSGGSFSSTAGLSINSSTGEVNLGTSTAGSYTVTYTVAAAGGCAQVQTTASISISTAPSATISYAGTPYCTSGGSASVTLTGTSGGSYSSTAGLSINSSTGAIDASTSTAGTYTVTYSVAVSGGCSVFSTTTSVAITAAPSATISYAGSPYCSNGGTASVTLTGTSGGAYSSTSGLSINSSTGAVNLTASTPGSYTVTYAVAAASGCAAFSTTASISITAAPAATINYAGTPYCNNAGTGTVTLTGTTGGGFSSTAGLSISASTGAINLATSTAGSYTVTYTVAASNGCSVLNATAPVVVTAASTWYADTDGDGFGDAGVSQLACAQPVGFVANSTDLCTVDPLKQAPGLCGCGAVDIDANSNGVCDSQELTPLVQLGVLETQGQLEFRLKADAAYIGLVSSTVVTVRWQTTAGVTVGSTPVLVDPTWNTSVGTVVAQGVTTNGIYSYATFVTFGNSNLGSGNGLVANTEKAFFRVPYTNTSGSCVTFEVIDDTYQDNQNLLWYISLAGQNKTNGYITGKTSTTGYPDAVCQNITVPLSAAGSLSITPAQVSANSPLNCGSVTNTITSSTFSCSNVGVNPVTLTATYANGSFETCISNVTVIDNLAPVVTTAAGALNATLQCSDASGLSAALALAPAATDNCAGPTLVLLSDITTSGTCPSAYTRVRTWKFTDASGNNSANYVQTISVIDNTAPVITTVAGALNTTLQCSNSAGLTAALAMQPVATDNCSTPTITLVSDVTTGSGCEYVRLRTWTFTDACGNVSTTFSQTITITSSVRVSARLFLDGPFVPATTRMKDDLRVASLIPTAQPYSIAPFGYAGTETVSPAVLAVNDPDNSIVDWVLVELRDNSTPNVVIARRAALLQRDGDVVDLDGSSALAFPSIGTNTYRVAVRHRNHLGAMTASGIALTNITTIVDFTTTGLTTYGTDATKVSGTSKVLWAGNALVDNRLRYTGANNDRDAILVYIGGVVPTNTIFNVYAAQDVNMNGNVRYTGGFNDRDPILLNLGGSNVTTQRFEQLP